MKVCSITDCERAVKTRGWCRLHYRRYLTTGDPLTVRRNNFGITSTRQYGVWVMMIVRCENPKDPGYKNYGARGIKVCDRWKGKDGYRNYISDIGPRPAPNMSVDRIDNDGDYEPSNVRWATKATQNINRRLSANSRSGYKGVALIKGKWLAYLDREGKRYRIGLFETIELAAQARKLMEQKYERGELCL